MLLLLLLLRMLLAWVVSESVLLSQVWVPFLSFSGLLLPSSVVEVQKPFLPILEERGHEATFPPGASLGVCGVVSVPRGK